MLRLFPMTISILFVLDLLHLRMTEELFHPHEPVFTCFAVHTWLQCQSKTPQSCDFYLRCHVILFTILDYSRFCRPLVSDEFPGCAAFFKIFVPVWMERIKGLKNLRFQIKTIENGYLWMAQLSTLFIEYRSL